MRIQTMLLILALLTGCAASNPAENETEFVTHIGVIAAKEVVEIENSGSESQVSTGVSASVSSGGGFSIGLGFLLSPLFDKSPDKEPVRYQVDLIDGGKLTVYHDSDDFEVGDCVEISALDDDDESLPLMKRIRGGC